MTCDLVCLLIDDFLDKRLSKREHQRLEEHISACPRCARELNDRLAFERTMRQSLATSVQHLQLSSAASRRTIQSVESGARQSPWSFRAVRLMPMMAGTLGVTLLLASLLLLLGHIPIPVGVQRAILSPASKPALFVDRSDISIAPQHIQPGDLFTVTVPIHSDFFRPVDTVRCILEITGPSGDYRFAVTAQGPFPSHGISILHLTPELLAIPSREQYQISPTDILSAPGAHTFRVTIFSPAVSPAQ